MRTPPAAFPPLREELALLPGPTLADGQASHLLHDPVRNLFFQIDWPTFEVLRRWDMGEPAAVAAAIGRETTLHLEVEDVEGVLSFLEENQLLRAPPGRAAEFASRLARRRGGLGERVLHNYLFFRVPLLKPDRWLGRLAPRLGFFYSHRFLLLTLAALVLGLVAVYRDWERFATTLVDTFTWSGLVSYGVALAAVKALHELGHAVTAKRLGCRVPTMGVAFLVLWPMAYTDTNESWRLTRRRDRLGVVAAGMLTELTVAAWATLAWALLPEGTPKALAFLLATTTWVSSVAINASPFMRFDGYFLLSDWLEMPNLHGRAFALARWDLRERLFALGEPAPEILPRRRHVGLILFAWATWLYRLVVFFGIALLVYAFFIKAVGIFLFLVEIVWFVLLPVWHEFRAWRLRWPAIRASGRARRSAALAAGALLLLAVPWPSRVTGAGLLRPAEHFVVHAPPRAFLARLPVAEGGAVKRGELLAEFVSPELASRRLLVEAKRERLRWQASAGAFDSEQRTQWAVLQDELATAEAELANLAAEAERYAPIAPFDGVLRDLDPELGPGVRLAEREAVARLVSREGVRVVALLDEEQVGLIEVGDSARFYADGGAGPNSGLRVVRIDRDASRTLPEAELAAPHGGSVAVREKKGQLFPERAVYRVTLSPDGKFAEAAGHTWRGKLVIAGRWTPPAWSFLRSALSVLWREAGF